MTLASLTFVVALTAADTGIPVLPDVEAQPLAAQVTRLTEAFTLLGEPLPKEVVDKLDQAKKLDDPKTAAKEIQNILDPLVFAWVEINPESRVKAQAGPGSKQLVAQGWKNFLVKVVNSAGVTAPLKIGSPNSKPIYRRTDNTPDPPELISNSDVRDRFLDAAMFDSRPMTPTLSGLAVEYRILQLFSRDAGQREATLTFNVGQGTQDLGFRSDVPVLLDIKPATRVVLHVRDIDGSPTTGWFIFRDHLGRVFPSQARRLAPDFFFHPQVYRADGESVLLPPGKYNVTFSRGPEYVIESREINVPAEGTTVESFDLHRWIHLKELGWYSGDHHIHAAGCAHYDNPTKGVTPADMFRHCVGEDLNVGACLSWGPCWYYQKTFFEGKVHDLSMPNYILRYDVEVSGFPSSHAGHLCLLDLKEDDYPGTTKIEEWPSWDLPVLQWGKKQGGVVGFSHSGWGLQVKDTNIPSLEMPKFDGIGANEFVVDIVHDACDFISAVDTPVNWELNVWYHTLNAGYRAKLSGETDFPCIYGERVGLGRGYVKIDGPLTFDKWVAAIKNGRSYVCDGLTHIIDFKVDDLGVGEGDGTIKLAEPKRVAVTARVAGLLKENADDAEAKRIRSRGLHEQPYWHIERARIEGTRKIPIELIVNGQVKGRQEIAADGSIQDVRFETPIDRSAWVALRIIPAAHTNPVFIEVGGKPVRGSKKSAQWCRDAVDVCWKAKENQIRPADKEAAKAAYEVARQAYDRIIAESDVD